MQVLIFCDFSLKTPIDAHEIVFLGQNRRKGDAVLTPNELVITFRGCYLCAVCGGNRSRNATVRVGVSPISPIWRLNGCQMITVNFGVSGPKFTKFLRDVERASGVLMRPSAFPSCHPLWNSSPKKEGVSPIRADLASKIGCHGNVP